MASGLFGGDIDSGDLNNASVFGSSRGSLFNSGITGDINTVDAFTTLQQPKPSTALGAVAFIAAILGLATAVLAVSQQSIITSNPDVDSKKKEKAQKLSIAIYISLTLAILTVLFSGGSLLMNRLDSRATRK